MKILLLADLHGVNYDKWQNLLKIDKGLFEIIATLGDINGLYLKQITEAFPDKKCIGVLGNHDTKGQLSIYGPKDIHGKITNINEISILGLEGSVRYKENNKAPLYTQMEIINLCNSLNFADIVLSHNSPFGIHDKEDIAHRGFQGLLNYIEKHSPKYCIHGHQHIDIETTHLETRIIGIHGASIFNTESGDIEKLF